MMLDMPCTSLRSVAICGSLVLALLATPRAQAPSAQPTDPDFAASVKEWTTAPEFSSPLVDHLPLAKAIPTPKDVLGHHVGAPKVLTSTADALRYYRALEKASPRIKVTTIGTTDEGREINVIYIADPETLKTSSATASTSRSWQTRAGCRRTRHSRSWPTPGPSNT